MKWKEFLKIAYPQEIAIKESKKDIVFRGNRWIGLRFAYLFYLLKIPARVIEAGRILMAFIALYFLSVAVYGKIYLPLLGVVLLCAQSIFDFSDGVIARATGKMSKFGEILEEVANFFGRLAILVLLAVFTGKIALVVFTVLLSYILVGLRDSFIEAKIAYDTELKGFAIFFRVIFSIQAMLFILPMLIVLNNIFDWDLAKLSYSVISIYTIITLIWFLLCLFKSPEKNN